MTERPWKATADVAIIGGGVIGAACALELAGVAADEDRLIWCGRCGEAFREKGGRADA